MAFEKIEKKTYFFDRDETNQEHCLVTEIPNKIDVS